MPGMADGAALAAILRAGDFPAAMALVEDGLVTLTAGAGVPYNTPFQAASIAKPLTSWAVMALVEAGTIDLDAPIWRYQRRFRPPPSHLDADGVTVRRIMSHTAGLGLADYPGHDPTLPHPGEAAALFGAGGPDPLRLVAEPGSGFRYSGGGWTLLQLAIEELTGRAFAEHMAEVVLRPLGMRDSGFARPDVVLPLPRDADGRTVPVYAYDAVAAAGLYATAPDLARFLAAHGDGGGVIGPASLAELLRPAAATGGVDGLWPGYGLGYEIRTLADGRAVVGHAAINRGWRCRMARCGAEGIVVLTASDRGMDLVDEVIGAWLESLSL